MRSAGVVAMLVVTLVVGGCTRDEGRTTVAGGEDHPKLPRGGWSTATATASASAAVGGEGSEVPPMGPPGMRPIEYRLAPGAGNDAPKRAKAYRLAPEKVDRERVRKIGDAFGVQGTIEGKEGHDFLLTEGGAVVRVAWGGVVTWSYTRDRDDNTGSSSSSGSMSCTSDGRCTSTMETVPPSTVPGLLSGPEAEAKARRVLGQAGIDLKGMKVNVGGPDDESRFVNFAPADQGGIPVLGLMTTMVFGEHGRIEFAGGYLSHPASVGTYDLADPATVLARNPRVGGNDGRAPRVVEVTTVNPILQLVTDGCPGAAAYLVPSFVFGPAEAATPPTGTGPIVAVVDADLTEAPPGNDPAQPAGCVDADTEPGLSPKEQRPVP